MLLRIVAVCALLAGPAERVRAQTPPPEGPPPATEAPSTPEGILRLAIQKREAGRNAEALEVLKALLKSFPRYTEANVVAGEICLDTNDYDSGRDFFKRVLDAEPSNFKANIGMGKIYMAARQWRQAVAFLEKAESVAPRDGSAEAKRLLAVAYAQMGHMQKSTEKALEAVQAGPDDLDTLLTLIQVRQTAASRDPQQIPVAVADAEKYLQKAVAAVERNPWDRKLLSRLNSAYQILLSPPPNVGLLQSYHNSFYQRDARNQPTDQLLPGKGPDAAAVLIRMADIFRQQALLNVIIVEHDVLTLLERAVDDRYDPKNVQYLVDLVDAYRQLQELTARLVGAGVYSDTTLHQRAIETCRKILELDPNNPTAQDYLRSAGVPLTTQPAPDSD